MGTSGGGHDLDREVCLCFHVTSRKLVNFLRRERPKVPSQLSECGGAGTGCGWCIPFLKQLFRQAVEGSATELERLSPQEYERRRAAYVRAGGGTPPPGATLLPPEEEFEPQSHRGHREKNHREEERHEGKEEGKQGSGDL